MGHVGSQNVYFMIDGKTVGEMRNVDVSAEFEKDGEPKMMRAERYEGSITLKGLTIDWKAIENKVEEERARQARIEKLKEDARTAMTMKRFGR